MVPTLRPRPPRRPQLHRAPVVGMKVTVPRISRLALRAATLLAVAAGLTVAAGGGPASSGQESIVQDDKALIYSGGAAREAALDDIVGLGADTIRVLVVWSRVAPSPDSITRPAGFKATDPSGYPGWAPYDELVASARSRGLDVILNPSGPGPAWASPVHRLGRLPQAL